MNELNCVITQTIQVSPIMKIIRVAPRTCDLPNFEAGQFVALYLPGSAERCAEATDEATVTEPDSMVKRAYSISSSSKDKEYFEFFISLVHSGSLSPRLFNLKVGDKIGMGKKAVGMFTLDEISNDFDVLLVATGTGIAPYMSMLRTDLLQSNRKVCVLHGANNSWDLGYSSELRLLENLFPQFCYVPTICSPDEEPVKWIGETKFNQELIKDGSVERLWARRLDPKKTKVFICGNPNMISSVMEILTERGFKEHSKKVPGDVIIEKF